MPTTSTEDDDKADEEDSNHPSDPPTLPSHAASPFSLSHNDSESPKITKHLTTIPLNPLHSSSAPGRRNTFIHHLSALQWLLQDRSGSWMIRIQTQTVVVQVSRHVLVDGDEPERPRGRVYTNCDPEYQRCSNSRVEEQHHHPLCYLQSPPPTSRSMILHSTIPTLSPHAAFATTS
ncbi:hypothetical protein EX30DRAFT_247395 [Ascodesmis nigricans]|uniref:Uncharacterized protein n=1 Tax=Ascodesmis nigricans TaxID=341454 RepID=A0A4S2MPK4_9PEZI|nr:hypothetical protein EX30DRAFT_247395 [Ascodesmis nigricans]